MGCADKQWHSLLADTAVKDMHVIPTRESKGGGGKDTEGQKEERGERKGKNTNKKKVKV